MALRRIFKFLDPKGFSSWNGAICLCPSETYPQIALVQFARNSQLNVPRVQLNAVLFCWLLYFKVHTTKSHSPYTSQRNAIPLCPSTGQYPDTLSQFKISRMNQLRAHWGTKKYRNWKKTPEVSKSAMQRRKLPRVWVNILGMQAAPASLMCWVLTLLRGRSSWLTWGRVSPFGRQICHAQNWRKNSGVKKSRPSLIVQCTGRSLIYTNLFHVSGITTMQGVAPFTEKLESAWVGIIVLNVCSLNPKWPDTCNYDVDKKHIVGLEEIFSMPVETACPLNTEWKWCCQKK